MIFGNGSRQIARLLLNYTPTNRCIIPLVGCSPPIFAAFSSPIQMNNREPALNRTEKATLIFTDIVFFGVAVAAALLNRLPPIPDWLFPLLVGLAAFRGGRAIAYNLIFHWLRDLFGVREVDDTSGAGKSNEATGHGIRRIIGELLCCPVCSATWVALGLLGIYVIYQPAGEIFTYALAAGGWARCSNGWRNISSGAGDRRARKPGRTGCSKIRPKPCAICMTGRRATARRFEFLCAVAPGYILRSFSPLQRGARLLLPPKLRCKICSR